MRIEPCDQTATRNLMRLVYNHVQFEQIRISNCHMVFGLSKIHKRMFFKDDEAGNQILRFMNPHEMKANTTRKQ